MLFLMENWCNASSTYSFVMTGLPEHVAAAD